MNIKGSFGKAAISFMLASASLVSAQLGHAGPNTPEQAPLFVSESAPPLNMLVMGRDHKLYYEAYNDASDLDGDGVLDVGFKPAIDYYGYFNNRACYSYQNSRFEPTATAGGSNGKECSNAWSGNFLNYLATSRMDALRKVLYGGYRATDASGSTTLRAAFIPQDAHSSGKEYDSVRDQFDISLYAPLNTPAQGFRHLFAVTTLTDGGVPILRVLSNSSYRIWNWVSKEGPVASDKCVDKDTNCTSGGAAGAGWSIVPTEYFTNLTITTWKGTVDNPGDKAVMDSLFNSTYTQCGTGNISTINTSGSNNNPFPGSGTNACGHDNYHTLITGTLRVPQTGYYKFAVDGDDAVDFLIGETKVASWYGGHAASSSSSSLDSHSGEISLIANTDYTIKFRHKEATGGDSWGLYFKAPNSQASTITDYNIDVVACPASNSALRESNCKAYPNNGTPSYKPTGILHDFGENDAMKFALLTGSYAKNTKGGVLRSNISSFSREINSTTGQFNTNISDGIVTTINKLRIVDFSYSNPNYQYNNCGWIGDGPISSKTDGMCNMWGNPIAEMMYEGLRYFAGASAAHSDYTYASDARDTKSDLNLPAPAWVSPYKPTKDGGAGQMSCAKPVMTVISDINPSYDYSLPGSRSDDIANSSDPLSIRTLDVSTETDAIGTAEQLNGKSFFIGQSNADNADNSPVPKKIDNLSYARGLSPEEPSKQGTFYSAGVAKFGAENPIGGAEKMMTYAIALASPLPQIKFPIGTGTNIRTVTLVPFAKSVGSTAGPNKYGISATSNFQPTNQIVDYYVVTIANTAPDNSDYDVNEGRPYAEFRINYEDVEQGADHDMDAIALYTLKVNEDGALVIRVDSEYASGDIIQNLGYVISGTDEDGIYLEVRDKDTDQDFERIRYKLNTPPTRTPGWCIDNITNNECRGLPLTTTRTFQAADTISADFLKDPLWYAAKYGMSGRDPASVSGDPDNYFLVTNATTLKEQLTNAFNDIMQRNSSVTSPAVGLAGNSASDSERYVYRTDYNIKTWSGNLIKEQTDIKTGKSSNIWSAASRISGSRNIKMANSSGTDLSNFTWNELQGRQYNGTNLQAALATDPKTGITPNINTDGTLTSTDAITSGQNRLSFIKGSNTSYRSRDALLGDIINSSPVVVEGAQYLSYLADKIEDGGDYADFISTHKNRAPRVYVGANDGMLHAFNAENGNEVFAFVPSAVIPNLNKLTSPDYNELGGDHHYYVDGTPVVRDVFIDGQWRTVLVGTLRAGGKSLFALDITNPASPSLLWEFSEGDDATDTTPAGTPSDVGYSFPTPTLARLHSGQWAVVTGNGYDSASGRAALFLIDIATGDLIKSIPTSETDTDNGLSSVRVADNNSDGIADYVYAGDLKGNLWRFDLIDKSKDNPFVPGEDINKSNFVVSFNGAPLFATKDGTTDTAISQAITAPPSLIRHPSMTGYIVMFGTGRYFHSTDKTTTDKQQTVYGIWDKQTKGETASSTPSLTRTDLLGQSFTTQAAATFANGDTSISKTIRVLSNNPITWHSDTVTGGKYGWYLDLAVNSTVKGERVTDEMAARGQVLFFTTRTPESDPCSAGLEGWAYGINPYTGGRTSFTVFDFNQNNVITGEDNYTFNNESTVASGFKAPAGGLTLSGGTLFNTDGSSINVNFGPAVSGRQTWQVLPEDDQ